MNSWWIFAIIYLVGWTLYSQFIKKATKRSHSDTALTIWTCLLGASLALLLTLFSGFIWPSTVWSWVMLICSCACYAVSDWAGVTSRRGLEVSTVSILNQITPVLTILLGILIFNEDVGGLKFIGASLIILSNILVLYQKGKFQWNKYVALTIIGNTLAAVAGIVDIGVSGNFSLPCYIVFTCLGPALILIIFGRVRPRQLIDEFQKGDKKAIIISGLGWGAGIIAGLKAYQLGEVSTVAPILATSTIINILVAYRLFHERDDFIKKIIAAAIIIIGVILISLG